MLSIAYIRGAEFLGKYMNPRHLSRYDRFVTAYKQRRAQRNAGHVPAPIAAPAEMLRQRLINTVDQEENAADLNV